jgi:hypothetical protein
LVYAGCVGRRVVVVDQRRQGKHQKQKRIKEILFVKSSRHVG